MALHTYDESGAQLNSLLAADPNHTQIVNYLVSKSTLPGHLVPTEFATGTGNITDVKDAGGHQPMLLLDQEGNASINLSTFPSLKFVIEAENEQLTTSGSKSGLQFDLEGHDTLTASSSSYDTMFGFGGADSIVAGAHDLIMAGSATISAGSADTIAGSDNQVHVPLTGNDTIAGSADVFTAHDSSHVKLVNEKSGAVELQFTNTGQTLTFTNPSAIEIHFSDGHLLKP